MTASTAAGTVRRNTDRHRYELTLDGEVAGFIAYREDGQALALVHTEVQPAHEGKGLAAQLAQAALEDAQRSGHKVVPSCSYVAAWIARHPQFADVVQR